MRGKVVIALLNNWLIVYERCADKSNNSSVNKLSALSPFFTFYSLDPKPT